jgi:hypothetical protein
MVNRRELPGKSGQSFALDHVIGRLSAPSKRHIRRHSCPQFAIAIVELQLDAKDLFDALANGSYIARRNSAARPICLQRPGNPGSHLHPAPFTRPR